MVILRHIAGESENSSWAETEVVTDGSGYILVFRDQNATSPERVSFTLTMEGETPSITFDSVEDFDAFIDTCRAMRDEALIKQPAQALSVWDRLDDGVEP